MSDSPQKQCTGPCGRILPATLDYFCVHKTSKYGVNSCCKKCEITRVKEYSLSHKEPRAVYVKEYASTHKEQICATAKRYNLSHKEVRAARVRTYRAHKRGNDGTHTGADICKQYENQKGKCYYCKKKVGTGKNAYHVDHVIPITKGGSNGPENLVIACPHCNMSKNNRIVRLL